MAIALLAAFNVQGNGFIRQYKAKELDNLISNSSILMRLAALALSV